MSVVEVEVREKFLIAFFFLFARLQNKHFCVINLRQFPPRALHEPEEDACRTKEAEEADPDKPRSSKEAMPLPPSPKIRSTPPPLPMPPLVLHAAPLAVRDAEEATAAAASRAHAAARLSMFGLKAERERGGFSLFLSFLFSTCEDEKKKTVNVRKSFSLFPFIVIWVDAIRPRRGFQDPQRQIPKQQDYVTLFFVLNRFGCCSCCEQASELPVGFDVVVGVVGVVWPMLSVASSSPPFAPLFAASDSAIWERAASLFFSASDNDRIVVLEPAAAATAAAEAQCKFVVVVVDRDDAPFIVCGLRHSVYVFFSFSFRSSSSSSR